MKIIRNKENLKYLDEIFNTFEMNETIASLILDFLLDYSSTMKTDRFYDEFLKKMEIDKDDKDFESLAKRYNLVNVKESNVTEYLKNQYLQNIKIKANKLEGYKLSYNSIYRYQTFLLNDITVDEKDFFKETPQLSFFNVDYSYPEISKNDTVWMSLIPHEINTMKEPLEKASGNIVVYGLGLGYFPYMASLKNDVKSITIVEKDKTIIKLFNENILPLITQKNKIKIIEDDAVIFAKSHANTYSFAFIDLWHDAEDGLELYMKFKTLENAKCTYSYWIEETLLASLRRALINLIYEETKENTTDKDYIKSANFNDELINKLHFYYKNFEIKNPQDIQDILRDSNLIKTAKELVFD